MIPYVLLILFIVILQIRNKNVLDKENHKYVFSLIILFLFAALRGNGDGDYFTYIQYSKYITTFESVINNNFPMEIGFRIISYFINIINANQQFVIIIMNAISITCVGIFINRYSSNKMMSVFLFLPFYFSFDMHTARTAVAIGISLLSLKYVIDKNFFKFLIVVLVSSAFHTISLAVLIIYFLAYLKINVKFGILLITMVVISTSIVSVDKTVISLFDMIGLHSIGSRYSIYVSNESYGYAFNIFDPRLIIAIGLFVFAKLRLPNPNEIEKLLINITWLSAIVMIVMREHTIFVIRMSSFFTIYSIVLVPLLSIRIKDCILLKIEKFKVIKYRKTIIIKDFYLVNFIVILFFTAYTAVLLYRNTVEYKFFFSSPFEIRLQEFLN